MALKLTPEKRAEAIEMLKDGASRGAAARHVGVSTSVISRMAKAEGIPVIPANLKMIEDAHDFNKAERRKVFNFAFQRGLELLEDPKLDSRAYREILTGLAIMTDKRRLEDGEATQHTKRTGDSIDWDAELAKADEKAREQAAKAKSSQA